MSVCLAGADALVSGSGSAADAHASFKASILGEVVASAELLIGLLQDVGGTGPVGVAAVDVAGSGTERPVGSVMPWVVRYWLA